MSLLISSLAGFLGGAAAGIGIFEYRNHRESKKRIKRWHTKNTRLCTRLIDLPDCTGPEEVEHAKSTLGSVCSELADQIHKADSSIDQSAIDLSNELIYQCQYDIEYQNIHNSYRKMELSTLNDRIEKVRENAKELKNYSQKQVHT